MTKTPTRSDKFKALQRAIGRARVHLIDMEQRGCRLWTQEARRDVDALEAIRDEITVASGKPK
jgi:hypothetical protein